MKVLLARSAGFCLGVSLALRHLDKALAGRHQDGGCGQGHERGPGRASSGRLITFGPIIHNPLVMRRYAAQGVLCEDNPDNIRPGDTVVVRAHGIPRDVEKRLAEAGATIVDATCPKVKKAQTAIAGIGDRRARLLLFGEKEHPEVRGLLSYAPGEAVVFGSLAELEALDIGPGIRPSIRPDIRQDIRPDDADGPNDAGGADGSYGRGITGGVDGAHGTGGPDRARCPAEAISFVLAAQTTQDKEQFQQACRMVSERLGTPVHVLDTICDATRDRQQGVLDLCGSVDAMVVVGGYNSGNTRRLAEVARAAGVFAVHVEQAHDLSEEHKDRLRAAGTVGLTAGASTPREHIESMHSYLSAL